MQAALMSKPEILLQLAAVEGESSRRASQCGLAVLRGEPSVRPLYPVKICHYSPLKDSNINGGC